MDSEHDVCCWKALVVVVFVGAGVGLLFLTSGGYDGGIRVASTPDAPSCLEQSLVEYWRERWPEKLQAYTQVGLDVKVIPLRPPGTNRPSLEAVCENVLRAEERTRDEWILEHVGPEAPGKSIGPQSFAATVASEVAARTERVDVLRAELLALSAYAFDLMIACERDILSRGEYDLDYLLPMAHSYDSPSRGLLVFTVVWAEHPWYIAYRFDSGDFPELNALLHEIGLMREALARELAEFKK